MKRLLLFLFLFPVQIFAQLEGEGSGLQGWWKFEDATGTTVTDSSGNGNNGTIIGNPHWTTGIENGGLRFGGMSDFVRVPEDSSLNTGIMSVAMWAKVENNLEGTPSFFGWGRNGCTDNYRVWWTPTGQIHASYQTTAGGLDRSPVISPTSTVKLGEWAHYVFTYDVSGSNVTITAYKNGSALATAFTSTSGLASCGQLTAIGSQEDIPNPAYQRTFAGVMDDFRVYNRVLSSSEVTTLYNELKPSSADVTAPTTPTGLTATAVNSARVDLSWTASTDAVGVVGYIIYRSGSPIDTILSGTTYSDIDHGVSSTWYYTVAPSTSYTYTVAAYDAAYNVSSQSSSASETTPAYSNTGPYTLTINKTGAGSGTISSIPAGISCGGTCIYSFNSGTVLNIAPYAFISGMHLDTVPPFVGWTGSGCTGTGTCYLTMSENKTLNAYYTDPPPTNKHYISTSGDNSDGSTWAKAWTSLSSVTWTRGDTYYIAGGTYTTNFTFPTTSGTSWVKLKKANAADNGSDTGWSASFASNQVVIAGYTHSSMNYLEIDGVTGDGKTTSGYGIKMYVSGVSEQIFHMNNSTGPYHFTHIEFEGPGFAYGSTAAGGLYISSGGEKGFHVDHCYFHSIPWNAITLTNGVGTSWTDYGMLIENNLIEHVGGVYIAYPSLHGQGIQIGYNGTSTYVIIRNNIFRDLIGTAFISYMGTDGSTGIHSYSRIYNNIFYITDHDTYYMISPGFIWSSASSLTDYFYIYNNTIFNVGDSGHLQLEGRISISSRGTITTVESKNNLWVSSQIGYPGHAGVTTSSNNDYYNNIGSVPTGETNQKTESSMPFTNAATYDLTLALDHNAIEGGTSLSGIVDYDFNEVDRPYNTYWDIGAYEYTGEVTPPTVNQTRGRMRR
jgi:hypothetical protein